MAAAQGKTEGDGLADGDVCVAQVEHGWVVTIEGPSPVALTYGTLRDAVEAGRRAATKSRLRLNLDASSDGASSVGEPSTDQLSVAT
jgi:hypothetical protein